MTARRVLQLIPPFSPYTTGAEALACFAADPGLSAAPVVDARGVPLGLVARATILMKLTAAGGRETFAAAPITALMDHEPLIVDADLDFRSLCAALAHERARSIQDGFIVTHERRYLGLGSGAAVLAAMHEDNEAASERLRLAMGAAGAAMWEADFVRERLIGVDSLVGIYQRRLTFDDVRRLGPAFIAPEDRETARKALADIGPGGGRFACRWRDPDGQVRWIEHAVKVFRGAGGAPARMILLTTDITAQKRARLEVQHALQRMETVLAADPLDVDMPPAVLEAAQSLEGNLAAAGVQDEETQVRAQLKTIFDEIAARDRALSAAAAAAEAASEAKSRFLASMSHDLRTPLNAIIGYAEILDEDLAAAGLPGPASDAQRIRGAARHLLHLINEILDISKIDAGAMDVTPASLDVAAIMRDAAQAAQTALETRRNTLDVVIADDIGAAHTDGAKLKQCLATLLEHAGKTASSSVIRLTGARGRSGGRDYLTFAIVGSRSGLTEQHAGQLFQPLIQGEAARGAGGALGLAITQRLAGLLGGDVAVRSEPEGAATITLRVPAHYRSDEALAGPDDSDADYDRPVVLVIDGDRAGRDLVHGALTRLGFAVRAAATGEAGLAAARDRHALIVIGMNLPDMSGWSVLEALRRGAAGGETPILLISREDDRARALALGACEHLSKPADRDAVAAAAVRFARIESPRAASPAKRPAPAPSRISNARAPG